MKIPVHRSCLCYCLLICVTYSFRIAAQPTVSADDLFRQARKAAFIDHDYPGAIGLCKIALNQSPDYTDIRNFLGRIYTWNHFPDSARQAFTDVLQKHPDNEDALIAFTDLEFWNDLALQALVYCERGLNFHPGSKPLLFRKVKLLNGLHRYREADSIIDTLLRRDSRDAQARALAQQIADKTAKNKIGVYYDYVYFNKEFNDPWHLLSIDYSRQTPIGAVIARINYANRFKTNGLQCEADAYPRISRLFYAYLNLGYSNDIGVFSKYRAGFSLYANLPKSFEAEAGLRYLYFSSNTWIYTASVGKYYKNYWFNFRTYLTPSNSTISQSYYLSARYYYGGTDDYLMLGLGTGISPDDRTNNIQLGSPYQLKSNKISGGCRHAIKKLNIIFANAVLNEQEYLPKTHGIQLDLGIGYQRRF